MEATIAGPFPKNEPTPQSRKFGFFNVISDPRTYGALLYMLLSLATGIFYFVWTVTGIALSRLSMSHHRRAVRAAVHRIGTRCSRSSKAASSKCCSACACHAGAVHPSGRMARSCAHPRRAQGHPHLEDPVLPPAQAAARHHLLHHRRHRPCNPAQLHRRRPLQPRHQRCEPHPHRLMCASRMPTGS